MGETMWLAEVQTYDVITQSWLLAIAINNLFSETMDIQMCLKNDLDVQRDFYKQGPLNFACQITNKLQMAQKIAKNAILKMDH